MTTDELLPSARIAANGLLGAGIKRGNFYSKIRQSFFNGKLSQSQVDGMEAILKEWELRALIDKRWLSYMLATVYHETAKTMQAIEEYGKGRGKKYGIPVNGHIYYGRGFVQLTWDWNYKQFGILNNPEKALELPTATYILFEGMIKGMFTGKKLGTYFNTTKEDWVNARRIINGTDKAELIASYGRKFFQALV